MSRQVWIPSLSLLASTQKTCAGPPGPAFGLGPAIDPVISVVVITLIAACGFALARKFGIDFRRRDHRNPSQSEAQRILAERYARGEIGRDEYLSKVADIQRSSI